MLGGAVGLAMGEAIIANVLPRKLAAIPNFASLGISDTITMLNDNIGTIHLIPVRRYIFILYCCWLTAPNQDFTLRNAVLHAWASSIATIWMVATALAGVALILTLFLREYSVDRKTVYSDDVEASGENEKPTSTGEDQRKEASNKPV